MTKKYNIQINRQAPTDTEITQYKNFPRLMRQYRRTKVRKPFHIFAAKLIWPLLLFIMLFVIFYYATRILEKKEKKAQPKNDSGWVSPIKSN
jgi:hypothetical protein